jgi:hypothetical protein
MSSRKGLTSVSFLGITIAVLLVIGAGAWLLRADSPRLDTPYQAVLLSNGQVYYGRLEGLGSKFPVLREVYYVQTSVNPQTKEPNNILLKRGNEWHGPDRMVLNANQVILVEPVGPTSKVAELIKELKAR